jgi:hypothetical protein
VVHSCAFASKPDWATHDNPRPELIWNYLSATGLDVAPAKADMQDPRIMEIIRPEGGTAREADAA